MGMKGAAVLGKRDDISTAAERKSGLSGAKPAESEWR
jgi:hypothetical protein